MKIIKIIFGLLAGLWALALVPKLIAGMPGGDSAFAIGHMIGSVVGILLASAICISLFRSALRN